MSTSPAMPAVTWADPQRQARFEAWIGDVAPRHGLARASLAPASADASFRRYLRLFSADAQRSAIVMDAPPPLEDVRPFVRVGALLREAGLHAPALLAADEEAGFLLLEDLGSRLYLDALAAATPAEADRLMRDACGALLQLQLGVPAAALPPFDRALLQRELDLFPEWCIGAECGLAWGDRERKTWGVLCERLIASALAQPVVAVHADWMPRNLMVGEAGRPGVLDFQDAVAGPVTYDLASLLRDAFLSWEEPQELDWAVRHWQAARRAGLAGIEAFADFGEFWRALEWMGLQRHLKVMGIFCRLKHRDGKPRYAADLPRFVAYAQKVALRYTPLAPLLPLLEPVAQKCGGPALAQGLTF